MANVRLSLLIAFAGKYLGTAMAIASFMLLARLLTPDDIGLFSVASALIGLAHAVRDFGVGSYLVQEKELTDERVQTAFTVTLLIALSLFLLMQIASPWIGDFYHDPRLVPVLRLLAINFLLIPLGAMSLAQSNRAMRFGSLFWVGLLSAIAQFGVTLALAFLGYGYMSQVWGSIAGTAATSLSAVVSNRENAVALRLTLCEWRRVVGFGGRSTAAGLVTELAMNVNDLVIGRVMGFSAVALVSRAQGVMNLFHREFMGTVRSVAFPAFAKAHREGEDMARLHVQTVTILTVIAWPFYGFMALFPLEVLRLLFGPQWDEAAPMVPIFCAAGAVAVLWNLIPQLLIAVGRVDYATRAEFLIQPARAAFLALVAIAAASMTFYALAFAFVYLASAPVFYWFLNKALASRVNLQLLVPLQKSAAVSALSLLVPALIASLQAVNAIDTLSPFVLVGIALIAALCWVLGLLWFNHPLTADPTFRSIKTTITNWTRINGVRREP